MRESLRSAFVAAGIVLLAIGAAPASSGQTITTTPPIIPPPSTFHETIACEWQANVGGAQTNPTTGSSSQGFNGGQFLRARNTSQHVLPRGTRLSWILRYLRSGQEGVQTRTGNLALSATLAVGGTTLTTLHLPASISGPMGSTPVTYTIESCEMRADYGGRR